MANRKTVADIDADIAKWLRRLNTATRKLTELYGLRRRIVTGKVRSPLPETRGGVKITLGKLTPADAAALRDELDDPIPSFGPGR